LRLIKSLIFGAVAGAGIGYCEIWMRYYEQGVQPYQFVLLLCSRLLLGMGVGLLVYYRQKIRLGRAIFIFLFAGIAITEILNFCLFG